MQTVGDATKSIMSSPHCKAVIPCPVVCLQVFKTTECDSRSLEELVLKRNEVQKLLQDNNKLKRKVHAAQEFLDRLQNSLPKNSWTDFKIVCPSILGQTSK